MKFQTKACVVLLSALLPWLPVFAQEAPATPEAAKTAEEKKVSNKLLFWKATSKTATAYLMGTIHIGKPDFYPLDAKVEKALAASDTLALEINLKEVDQLAMQKTIMQKGMYLDGTTLKDHVADDVWKKFSAYAQKEKLPMLQMMRLKPGLITMTLAQQTYAKLGYKPEHGVEMYLTAKVEKAKKKIISLEKIEDQLNLLLGGTDKEQETQLKAFLKEADKVEEISKKLIKAWKESDEATLLSIFNDAEDSKEHKAFMKKMIDDRNVAMAKKVEEHLGKTGTLFVAVGAGHLVGKIGIPALLKEKGFTVEQIQKTPKSKEVPKERPAESKPEKELKKAG